MTGKEEIEVKLKMLSLNSCEEPRGNKINLRLVSSFCIRAVAVSPTVDIVLMGTAGDP
jgi:hypothetical protein